MTHATRTLSESEVEDLAAYRAAQEADAEVALGHEEGHTRFCDCYLTRATDELRESLGKERFALIQDIADEQDKAERSADRKSW